MKASAFALEQSPEQLCRCQEHSVALSVSLLHSCRHISDRCQGDRRFPCAYCGGVTTTDRRRGRHRRGNRRGASFGVLSTEIIGTPPSFFIRRLSSVSGILLTASHVVPPAVTGIGVWELTVNRPANRLWYLPANSHSTVLRFVPIVKFAAAGGEEGRRRTEFAVLLYVELWSCGAQ